MNSITREKIQQVVDKIVKEYQPEKIILFGSWAWGEPHEDSDVDLFVLKDTEESTRDVARKIDGSIFPRPFPLDIIVYKPDQAEKALKYDFFIRNIISRGRVLYAKQ